MVRLVQKFGGTSVADIDRIRVAAGRVAAAVEAGNEVAVVVSAMAGTTDRLVEWTREIAPFHDAREYDVVVSSGEQATVGLMALALQAEGVDARSWLGWQVPILTDDVHGRARISDIDANASSLHRFVVCNLVHTHTRTQTYPCLFHGLNSLQCHSDHLACTNGLALQCRDTRGAGKA